MQMQTKPPARKYLRAWLDDQGPPHAVRLRRRQQFDARRESVRREPEAYEQGRNSQPVQNGENHKEMSPEMPAGKNGGKFPGMKVDETASATAPDQRGQTLDSAMPHEVPEFPVSELDGPDEARDLEASRAREVFPEGTDLIGGKGVREAVVG